MFYLCTRIGNHYGFQFRHDNLWISSLFLYIQFLFKSSEFNSTFSQAGLNCSQLCYDSTILQHWCVFTLTKKNKLNKRVQISSKKMYTVTATILDINSGTAPYSFSPPLFINIIGKCSELSNRSCLILEAIYISMLFETSYILLCILSKILDLCMHNINYSY